MHDPPPTSQYGTGPQPRLLPSLPFGTSPGAPSVSWLHLPQRGSAAIFYTERHHQSNNAFSVTDLTQLNPVTIMSHMNAPPPHHQHRPSPNVLVVPFETCQSPGRCTPESHGWATLVEFCYRRDCNAERRGNFNAGVAERGTWHPGLTGKQETL